MIGIVGNWSLAQQYIKHLDFYRGGEKNKEEILRELGAGHTFKLYVADTEEDQVATHNAGWNFIFAKDFR